MTTLVSTLAGKQTLSPYRLRRHADYQHVYKASRKYHSASFSYFVRVRAPDEEPVITGPRIGLTVGRVMGKAVQRNRIKRRMREAVRLNLALLLDAPPAQSNLDLVLHPRKSVAMMDFALLNQELGCLFRKVAAKALKPDPPPVPREFARPIKATEPPARQPSTPAKLRSRTTP